MTFIQSLYDFNICTYYLLPLIKLNKYSFGTRNNFKQCYLNREGDKLFVKVGFKPEAVELETYYLLHQEYDSHVFLIFSLPKKWKSDVEIFMLGRYSKMSTEAKEMIRCYSGLHYLHLHAHSGKPYTDARLMAIDEDSNVRALFRQRLEEELGVTLADYEELISSPSATNYIDTLTYESNISQPIAI